MSTIRPVRRFPSGRTRHADMLCSRAWQQSVARWRADPKNARCAAGLPVVRGLRRTQPHHEIYRCGVCGTGRSYWSALSRHWDESPCGDYPADLSIGARLGEETVRFGGERMGDLCPLCDFHHGLFELLLRLAGDLARARHQRLPDRATATAAYVLAWRVTYVLAGLALVLAVLR